MNDPYRLLNDNIVIPRCKRSAIPAAADQNASYSGSDVNGR